MGNKNIQHFLEVHDTLLIYLEVCNAINLYFSKYMTIVFCYFLYE